jgi:hypothetical protein
LGTDVVVVAVPGLKEFPAVGFIDFSVGPEFDVDEVGLSFLTSSLHADNKPIATTATPPTAAVIRLNGTLVDSTRPPC